MSRNLSIPATSRFVSEDRIGSWWRVSVCVLLVVGFARLQTGADLAIGAEPEPAGSASTANPAIATSGEDSATDEAGTSSDSADTEVAAGHSMHGEAFDEGPRQRAYLMGNTGNVQFNATSASADARQFIDQGIGQLHGFWYFEAERSFRQAASLDPDCAIAYWGMAQANTRNAKRAKQFLAEAVERRKHAGDREQRLIDALDTYYKAKSATKDEKRERSEKYVSTLEKIAYNFPDEIEMKAMIALQLWSDRAERPITSHLALDALLGEVLAANPMHPCHHYRIHLWDNEQPERALESAARCGQSAPDIAHMWHMPGHIYSRLHRYADAVWQQEASARVDHAHMIRDRVLPDQIHNFAHNNEWLIRNLNNLGRIEDAISLAKNMIELPQHPSYNTIEKHGSQYYGRLRLFETLTRYERWDDLIALCDTPYLAPTEKELEQVRRLRHLGQAYFRSGNFIDAELQLAELEQRLTDQQRERDQAGDDAKQQADKDKKNEADTNKAVSTAKRKFSAAITRLEAAVAELKAHQAVASGNFKQAIKQFDKASGVSEEYVARVLMMDGQTETAIEKARKLVKSNENEVVPLATLIELLSQADRQEEMRKSFDELLDLSGWIDLNSPVFARLTPIAVALGLSEDWRTRPLPADDIGNRPALKTLGPFRWHPSQSHDWTLIDATGSQRSLKDYSGRPVVVIFYLGFGCLHCAEQLQAFAPQVEEFEKAGLSLIAVSTDKPDALTESQKNYDDGSFPFPLVSDSDHEVFKAWRCWDDFEDKPLHGTFLIDGDGLIRWQDIGHEPFNNPKFVLEEATRLLGADAVRLAGNSDG